MINANIKKLLLKKYELNNLNYFNNYNFDYKTIEIIEDFNINKLNIKDISLSDLREILFNQLNIIESLNKQLILINFKEKTKNYFNYNEDIYNFNYIENIVLNIEKEINYLVNLYHKIKETEKFDRLHLLMINYSTGFTNPYTNYGNNIEDKTNLYFLKKAICNIGSINSFKDCKRRHIRNTSDDLFENLYYINICNKYYKKYLKNEAQLKTINDSIINSLITNLDLINNVENYLWKDYINIIYNSSIELSNPINNIIDNFDKLFLQNDSDKIKIKSLIEKIHIENNNNTIFSIKEVKKINKI